MPRPVFDINEYELRGLVPDVFTEEQKALLNKTLARANGQIDWTAQLLGYNGPSYWGLANLKKDGTYNWTGLPETMNEKRQLQVGTFGVFGKDKDYSEWPAPFNRSEIKASGDANVHVWESEDKTRLGPLGQPETIDYGHNPIFFVGATYIFDQHVEFSTAGSDPDQVLWSTTFYKDDRKWTRLSVKQSGTVVGVKLVGSLAKEAYVEVIPWVDSSDWNYAQVVDQFLGVWGNKGSAISFDAQFDALDIHGFDERYGLTLTDLNTPLTLTQILAKVGLEPTQYTEYWNTRFGFKIGDCTTVYPLPTIERGELYDNTRYDRVVTADDEYLTDGFFGSMPPVGNVTDEGEYEKPPFVPEYLIPDNFEFFECDSDCSYTMDLTQTFSDSEVKGIGSILFKYETKADCSLIDLPCVEWVFDPTLDNGSQEDTIVFPTVLGPWATANDGEYDETHKCYSPVKQGGTSCEGGFWCSFDDGEFDENVEPNCDASEAANGVGCLVADGGSYTVAGPPDYEDCSCAFTCCEINNGLYVFDETPYLGPEIANGGEYTFYADCIIYDNSEYLAPADIPDYPIKGTVDNSEFPRSVLPSDLLLQDGTFADMADPAEVTSNGIYPLDNTPTYTKPDDLTEPNIVNAVCYLDNGQIDVDVPPSVTADSRIYDRTLLECVECEITDQIVPVPCPIESVYVSLAEVFDEVTWEMRPTMKNSLTPLRLWKSRPLTALDEPFDTFQTQYNFLIADENQGPDELGAFRHFARLPLEYPREGKFWNRTQAVCNNQSYFSAPPELAQTDATPPSVPPRMWAESYYDQRIGDYEVFYAEAFLCSIYRNDTKEVQEGFEDSRVTAESNDDIPYASGLISEFDAYAARIPYENGDWRGNYYYTGSNKARTGFLLVDITSQNLREVSSFEEPIADMSNLKLPNAEFPDSVDTAAMKNYVVSYAYFVCDFSAADDPVFDPQIEHCWRKETIACSTPSGADCAVTSRNSNTAYLLHSPN